MTRHLHPVPAAAEFLASQPGQPDLALRIHHPGPDGKCAGCFGEHRPYPCLIAGLALAVQARQESRRSRRRSPSAAPLEVLGVHGWRDDAVEPHSGPQGVETGDAS